MRRGRVDSPNLGHPAALTAALEQVMGGDGATALAVSLHIAFYALCAKSVPRRYPQGVTAPIFLMTFLFRVVLFFSV